jgi:integrase
MIRILAKSDEFKPGDMDAFPSSKRLKDNVTRGSWHVFRIGLALYCNFSKMNPDELVADREKSLALPTVVARRRHEDIFTSFVSYVESLKSKVDPSKNLAPNTVNSRLMAVRAFYDWNYLPLTKVKAYPIVLSRQLRVPTRQELGLMLKAVDDPLHRALILAEAQSGISEGDLLSLTWETKSAAWGTVREQMEGSNPYGIIHLHFVREKTKVVFDSFLGRATVAAMKELEPKGETRVFPVSKRVFQKAVHDAGVAAKLHGDVVPHSLRKFFTTSLKTTRLNDPAFNNDLIEYWSAHSLGRTKAAYFVPSSEAQAQLYVLAEPRLTPEPARLDLGIGTDF